VQPISCVDWHSVVIRTPPLLKHGNRYKVFIANHTMTLDQEPLHNYGFTGLKTCLDTHMYKPTTVTSQKEINCVSLNLKDLVLIK